MNCGPRQRGSESQVAQQDARRLPRRCGAGAAGDQTRRRGPAARDGGAEGGTSGLGWE